jgi:alpha-galactosidase
LGKPLNKTRGTEYAANVLNARLGDGTPFEFNANLLNQDSIPNLPQDACVEIPVVADPKGYHRKAPQPLPSAPAILVNQTAMIENLVYEAYTEKSKQKVIQAVSLDPLCGAVLSLEEIRQMCEEIFAANGDYLAEYR